MNVVVADITTLDVDVVVNAANPTLLGGGGVDGAIHGAAGPGLLQECRGLGGARTGEVKFTAGHGLRARAVARAVAEVLAGSANPPSVTFCCFPDGDGDVYREAARREGLLP